jgi:hypothetical protein
MNNEGPDSKYYGRMGHQRDHKKEKGETVKFLIKSTKSDRIIYYIIKLQIYNKYLNTHSSNFPCSFGRKFTDYIIIML